MKISSKPWFYSWGRGHYGSAGKNNTGNAGPNAVLSATLVGGGSASFTYDNNGNLISGAGKSITYNAMNKPTQINAGGTTVSFSYDANWQRYKKVIGSSKTLYYIDGSVEVEYTGGDIITRTYIDDIAVIKRTKHSGLALPSHEITYTLRDRLGSVVTLTNHNNLIMEHRSYDPFGKPRFGTMQASPSATLFNVANGTPFTMRGFTDHEHIDEAQLIHMNGRVYDYNLGRFLSVDPFIQEPGNSQSLNPYSYIMNNPLAGTDPSGYLKVCDTLVICSHKQATDSEYNRPIILSSSAKNDNGNDKKQHGHGSSTQPEPTGINSPEAITGSGNRNSEENPGTEAPSLENFNDTFSGAVKQFSQDLLTRANELIAEGDLDGASKVLDVYEDLFLNNDVEWHLKFNIRGPADAEATVQGEFIGSQRDFKGDLTFFRGAVDAYLTGSKAADGYIVDLKPGMHALLGLLGHESGHMVFEVNFERVENPETGEASIIERQDKEKRSDMWLKFIYPGKY